MQAASTTRKSRRCSRPISPKRRTPSATLTGPASSSANSRRWSPSRNNTNSTRKRLLEVRRRQQPGVVVGGDECVVRPRALGRGDGRPRLARFGRVAFHQRDERDRRVLVRRARRKFSKNLHAERGDDDLGREERE